MKVLKKRALWEKKITCYTCKAKLLIDESDVEGGYSGLDNEFGYYIECPECKHGVNLDERDLPEYVKDKACR